MKKVLSLVLAGSMVLSLAACGGSKDTASTTDSSAASSAETITSRMTSMTQRRLSTLTTT